MLAVHGRTFNEVYQKLIQQMTFGERVGPRGKPTRELPDRISWTVDEPWNCWLTVTGRRLNPFFAAAEIFWILWGRADTWICNYNKNMRSFLDPGNDVLFNAPYGQRIFKYPMLKEVDQLETVVKRLVDDPDTRRAVISLWHPVRDARDSLDVACNNIVQFLIRNGKLHTSIYQRSNDLVWGTPYNMLQFYHLSCLLRGELLRHGVSVGAGSHTVTIGSLHVYEDLYEDTRTRLFSRKASFPQVTQNNCDAPLDRLQLADLALMVFRDDRTFRSNAQWAGGCEDVELVEPETLYELTQWWWAMRETPQYWVDLACMPVLWRNREKWGREEIQRWADDYLPEVLTWAITDFWAQDV